MCTCGDTMFIVISEAKCDFECDCVSMYVVCVHVSCACFEELYVVVNMCLFLHVVIVLPVYLTYGYIDTIITYCDMFLLY